MDDITKEQWQILTNNKRLSKVRQIEIACTVPYKITNIYLAINRSEPQVKK